jgi:Fic family protein
VDRSEEISEMEPLLIAEASAAKEGLHDLVIELVGRSAGFRRSLPVGLSKSLSDLVRSMNCYYSNLIEGNYTHPIDIERAMQGDYSSDTKKRNLQREAKAHIKVQKWIDEGGLIGSPVSISNLREIHYRFCNELPEELLWVENKADKSLEKVVPSEFRTRDVAVGKHVAISPGAIPRFLQKFEEVYSGLGKSAAILALAAMHHRFVWIHPFLDGNGRVVRLMSHAVILQTLDTGAIWSIARGLGRNIDGYKSHLADCDLPRRNDLDGRGALSHEALVRFTKFFLETCIDQVNFMENLMQPEHLLTRIRVWAKEEAELGKLPPTSNQILEAVFYRDEVKRTEIAEISGLTKRTASRNLSALLERNVLISDTPRGPVRISLPASLASRWMPGLFPEKVDGE